MQTLPQQQSPFQKQKSSSPGGPTQNPTTVTQEHPLLEVQRTVGNQAVQRLLQQNAEAPAGLGPISQLPSLAIQRQPAAQVTQPTFIKQRRGDTDRVDDAYGPGTLDETQWRNLLDSAERAIKNGDIRSATTAYLTLYADIAKLAQADRVVPGSPSINVVTGTKSSCTDARPGLNLSLLEKAQWGANATTSFVDSSGKFGVPLNPHGRAQPLVAIVLSRSAFRLEKEQTLAALRHEMVHAEHDADDAARALSSDPKDTSPPTMTTAANSELLAYIEGFMTMFHLTHPAPNSADHPAFVQLLGALDVGKGETLPWAEADPAVKSEALGRLQEYYCHALDEKHRESFAGFVRIQLDLARADEYTASVHGVYDGPFPETVDFDRVNATGGNPMVASVRNKRAPGSFFRSLKRIVEGTCEKLTTPMKL